MLIEEKKKGDGLSQIIHLENKTFGDSSNNEGFYEIKIENVVSPKWYVRI